MTKPRKYKIGDDVRSNAHTITTDIPAGILGRIIELIGDTGYLVHWRRIGKTTPCIERELDPIDLWWTPPGPTPLELARTHLQNCQRVLAFERQAYGRFGAPTGATPLIRHAERGVLGALSWVWEEQQREDFIWSRTFENGNTEYKRADGGFMVVRPVEAEINENGTIIWKDGSTHRIIAVHRQTALLSSPDADADNQVSAVGARVPAAARRPSRNNRIGRRPRKAKK